MDVNKILSDVDRLHASAKNGSVTVISSDGARTKYNLVFNGRNYNVFDLSGNKMEPEFNTRILSVAKKWAKEWFAS